MRRLLIVLASLLLGASHALAASPAAPSAVHVYNYDGYHDSAARAYTSTERGPPAMQDHSTDHDAGDPRSRGASARSCGATPSAACDYDHTAPLVRVARTPGTTEGRARVLDGNLRAFSGARSAANGGSDVVRHYTTREAAEAITKGGSIEPGAASGKIWLTPDRYASGAEARAKLALNKTPDGYFEIPMCRVRCPSAPGKVEPYYNQPGGGIEITTEFPIDIRGLIFRSFE